MELNFIFSALGFFNKDSLNNIVWYEDIILRRKWVWFACEHFSGWIILPRKFIDCGSLKFDLGSSVSFFLIFTLRT